MDLSSRAKDFRERLGERVFVADGAMGTMLYARGVFINRCFDELNLSSPQLVLGIHQEYVAAGAEILETNTYGANHARLKSFGLADQVEAINGAGVRLAQQAAQGRAFVAGAMGHLGVHIEPLGTVPAGEARAIFRQQADALCHAGADLLILETFTDLHELHQAVLAARDAAGETMVIVAQVAIDDEGELPGRTSLRQLAREIADWPFDVLGFNCCADCKRPGLYNFSRRPPWTSD
jgi:methionine synthase I (cobalamin-dependent)